MTHELSPTQLEAATIQRRTMDDLIDYVEQMGMANRQIIHEDNDNLTIGLRDFLVIYRGRVTFDVDAYRADHSEIGAIDD